MMFLMFCMKDISLQQICKIQYRQQIILIGVQTKISFHDNYKFSTFAALTSKAFGLSLLNETIIYFDHRPAPIAQLVRVEDS